MKESGTIRRVGVYRAAQVVFRLWHFAFAKSLLMTNSIVFLTMFCTGLSQC